MNRQRCLFLMLPAAAILLVAAAGLSDAAQAQTMCTTWDLAADFETAAPNNPDVDACGNQIWHYYQNDRTNIANPYSRLQTPTDNPFLGVARGCADPVCSQDLTTWYNTSGNGGENCSSTSCLPFVQKNNWTEDRPVVVPDSIIPYMPGRSVNLHPSDNYAAAVGWKSPITGVVSVEAFFALLNDSGSYTDGVTWHVEKNSESLGSGLLQLNSEIGHIFRNPYIEVNKDETIYFLVGKNGGYGYDSTRLEVAVKQVAGPQTIVLGTGSRRFDYKRTSETAFRDGAHLMSRDGTTWQNPYIVDPSTDCWSGLIAGTRWLNYQETGSGTPPGVVKYRTTFELPQNFSGASMDIQVHCDNFAYFRLNGAPIGNQEPIADSKNFSGEPEIISTSSYFKSGTNTLEIDATGNAGVCSGLDYQATVTYGTGKLVSVAGGPYSCSGATVKLDGSKSFSTDQLVAIADYKWYYDRDSNPAATGAIVNALPCPATGSITVALEVSAQDGLYPSKSFATVTRAAAPAAMITEPSAGTVMVVGDPITFRAQTAANIAVYRWSSNLDGPLASVPTFTTAGLTPGTHAVDLRVEDAGGTSSETSVTVQVLSESQRTDLALEWGDISFWTQDGSVELTNPEVGEQVLVKATVHNLSDQPTQAGTVKFFDVYGNEATPMAGSPMTLPAIPARGAHTVSIPWNTVGLVPDYHVVQVWVSKDNLETYIANNQATRFVVLGSQRPAGDMSLEMSGLSVPSRVFTGDSIDLTGAINYHWGNDYTLPMMGGRVKATIGGQTWEILTVQGGKFGFGSQAPITPGQYTLTVEATDSTLTQIWEFTVQVVPPPGPDLVVSGLALMNYLAGESETVYATLANVGGVDAGASSARIEIWDPAGTKVVDQSVPVPALAARASATVSAVWSPQIAGTHSFKITADSGNVIEEGEPGELNNSAARAIYLYPHHVDLRIRELRQSCDVIWALVENIGGLPATSGSVAFAEGNNSPYCSVTWDATAPVHGKGYMIWKACQTGYPHNAGTRPTVNITATAASLDEPSDLLSNNSLTGMFTFNDAVDTVLTDLWVNDQQSSWNNIAYLSTPAAPVSSKLTAWISNSGCGTVSGTVDFLVENTVIASASFTGLAAGTGLLVNDVFTFTNPPYPAALDYRIAARVTPDAGDVVAGNNLSSERLWVYPAMVDYEMTSANIDFSPNTEHPKTSDKILVTAYICNRGLQTGSGYQVAFYEEGQGPIGVIQTITEPLIPVPTVDPGNPRNGCVAVTPKDTNGVTVLWGNGYSGNHVILVSVAPVVGSQDDPSEGNNQATRELWVNFPPTAAVKVAGTRPDYSPKEPVTFDASASSDGRDLDGIKGIDRYEWSFSDGTTGTTTAPSYTKSFASPNTYTATVKVYDVSGEFAAASTSVTVKYSDFQTATVTASLSGQVLKVTAGVKNGGAGSAGASLAGVYFSANTAWDENDKKVGDLNIIALSSGQTSTTPATPLTIPSNVPSGKYYVIVYADRPDAIGESIETNNTKATKGTYNYTAPPPLPPPGIDLVVVAGSVPLSPTAGKVGSTATVNYVVKNQGVIASGTFFNRIWFSTDASFGGTDIKVTPDSGTSGPLNSGSSTAAQTWSFTVPAGLTARVKYYVGVCTDAGLQVTESVESNNCTSMGQFTVR